MSSIDFSELPYEKMIANPMVVPAKKCPSEVYEIFKQYKEFSEKDNPTPELDRKKLFRYIPLVYDKESPLHKVINDFKRLKGKAAELAGFKKDSDGNYLQPVIEMLECRNRTVNHMIIRYVIAHKNATYHEQVVLREAHMKLSVKVIEDPDDKTLKNFKTVSGQLDQTIQDLLSHDNNDNLRESFDEYYFEDQLKLRPEDIAKKRKAGVRFAD